MAVAILAFSGVAACTPTRPPLDQLHAASRALGAARDAGAAELAGPTYRAAAQRFDDAQAAESRGKYAQALDLAAESQVSSELATAQARLARLRGEVDRLRRENAAAAGDLRQPSGTEFQP